MKHTPLKIGIITILFFAFLLVIVPIAKAEPYGWSPSVDNSWQGTPTCTDLKPDKAPILLQPNHPLLPNKPKAGEVVLYWHKVPGANGYNIYYGLSPNNYIFTAPDLPDTDNFTVSHLANRVYYFAVQSKNGCAASSLSNEWAGRPGSGGYISAAAVGFVPIVRGTTPLVTDTTTSYTPSPTAEPMVQGITAEPSEDVNYQPPAEVDYNPPVAPVVPKPTPKPGLWQAILRFFGLAK